MHITHLPDYLLSPTQRAQITTLLQSSFPQYPPRAHFRQIPHFRILAHDDSGTLLGHIAVEHRLVHNAGQVLRIFGLADVCMHPDHQNKGLGTKLLNFLESLAREAQIEALLLIAPEPEFYLKNDFLAVENDCKWLFLQGDQTLGVLNRKIGGLMVKMLGEKGWREGQLDLLGHIF
ncbi:MAG: GNAT family N-acetyltransferase [Haliscomenobacter sp.]|uniref:GNAT family N-acetyltransferase n=1 Tax=Haliscomenobacter sp. TaxID=2717303 RepID=UPI0029A0422B|nr:GNAT family N-acetyltransferase [Haliscomenobacter sp.]MDX2067085.1 GNAT family N-acetyltransferase [Haliscomenobacter sp.]